MAAHLTDILYNTGHNTCNPAARWKEKEDEEEANRKEFLHAAMRLERLTVEVFDKPAVKLLSLTIPLSPAAQHSNHRQLQTWQLREKSWSVMEQLCLWVCVCMCVCVCVCVSSWQPAPSCGHARLCASLQESFIIQ